MGKMNLRFVMNSQLVTAGYPLGGNPREAPGRVHGGVGEDERRGEY